MNRERTAVKLENVSKSFGDVRAVRDIDLKIEEGEIFGLLGPNGSGKTTTMRIMIGLTRPDSGSVRVLNEDVTERPTETKKKIGYVPESSELYEFLTGQEYLDFVGNIYGLSDSKREDRIGEYLKAFELEGKEADMIKSYSGGMKQKIALISAFLHKPKVLFMDEPVSGLDPKSAKIVKDFLRELTRQGVTVVISTHVLGIAEAICDRISIMRNGKILAEGDIEGLREKAKLPDSDLEDVFLKLTESDNARSIVEALLE